MRVVIVSVALILGLVWLPSPAGAGDFTGVPLVPPGADEELVTIQRVGASGQVVLYHTASTDKWGFWSVWNRRTGAVVRVGDGNEAAMSTDGKFVIYLEPLSLTSGSGTRVVVYDVSDGTRTTVNRRTDDGSFTRIPASVPTTQTPTGTPTNMISTPAKQLWLRLTPQVPPSERWPRSRKMGISPCLGPTSRRQGAIFELAICVGSQLEQISGTTRAATGSAVMVATLRVWNRFN